MKKNEKKLGRSPLKECELWQPKTGEFCWFWNDTTLFSYPQIARFERMLQDAFDTDIGSFDYCELYRGELPSLLKESK